VADEHIIEDAGDEGEGEESGEFYSEGIHSPAAVAARLREIADMIERGELTLGATSLALPEELGLAIELEQDNEDDGIEYVFELEISWFVEGQE
jgi:amphi-Trp domain-containing protein